MHTLTRRQWLRTAGAGSAALALAPLAAPAADTPQGFTLPPLPYPFNALEPAIDTRTMEIHHDRHHKAYVDNLNAALAKHPDWLRKPIEEIIRNLNQVPSDVRTAVRNNGGGHYNHSLFWTFMGPRAGGEPTGPLGDAITQNFRSFAAFKTEFKDKAMKQFGSGWAWLVQTDGGKLAVMSTPNQDSPLTDGQKPILGIDVWEHAYYLKYQNNRGGYVDQWWSVVNWKTAGERFAHRG
jgi:Fe-Mn family superoxide dismutase